MLNERGYMEALITSGGGRKVINKAGKYLLCSVCTRKT